MFTVTQADEQHLRFDRNLYHDLMRAGVEPKFHPTSTAGTEKGVDVALAIDALQAGLEGKIDIAVLVSGDADLVPVARALMKQGVRVVAAFFEYKKGEHNSWVDDRFRLACNYQMNVTQLEGDKDFKSSIKGCFSPRPFVKQAEPGRTKRVASSFGPCAACHRLRSSRCRRGSSQQIRQCGDIRRR